MQDRKKMAFIAVTLTSLLLLALVTGCGHNKQLAEENRIANAQLADLQKRLSDIEVDKNKVQKKADNLQMELAQLAEREKLNLQKLDQYSVLSLPNTLVFNSGSVRLSPEGMTVLGKIADVLKRYPDYEIRIEGHTDNMQIRPEFQNKYATNWELSSARATAVIRHLISSHKMQPLRLGAVGYGEHRPAATNDSEEGRAKNRRVEFHVYPAMQSRVLNPKG